MNVNRKREQNLLDTAMSLSRSVRVLCGHLETLAPFAKQSTQIRAVVAQTRNGLEHIEKTLAAYAAQLAVEQAAEKAGN